MITRPSEQSIRQPIWVQGPVVWARAQQEVRGRGRGPIFMLIQSLRVVDSDPGRGGAPSSFKFSCCFSLTVRGE